MSVLFILALAVAFAISAPGLNRRYGGWALWLLAAGCSLVAALTVALFASLAMGGASVHDWRFFWPAATVAATGFAAAALRVRLRGRRPYEYSSGGEVLAGVLTWALGAAVGGAIVAGGSLLLLNGMAP